MGTQKVAITIPDDIIGIIDIISKQEGVSRSKYKYISQVLRNRIKEENAKKLTSIYNDVFLDESIRKEQLETSEWFEGAGNNEGETW
jgi:hypothetical protein